VATYDDRPLQIVARHGDENILMENTEIEKIRNQIIGPVEGIIIVEPTGMSRIEARTQSS